MKEEEIRKKEVLNKYLKLVERDVKKILVDRGSFLIIRCPSCGSGTFDFQFQKSGFSYVLCRECATLFANPRPSLESLHDFYAKSESSVFWVEEFFKPMVEARREKIFRPQAEFVRDALAGRAMATVGDIGAGFGIFLEELAKFWPTSKMIAIDASPDMAELCRSKNLEVITQMIEDVGVYKNEFDFLACFALFEHLHDPGNMLEKVFELLKPGGYFLMTTLNGQGFDIQLLWEHSKSIAPHHLNFFNPASISYLLRTKRFKIKDFSTPGQLDWNLVESAYREDGVDPGRFWRLVADGAREETKKNLQTWIADNNLSSYMRILCQKPAL